LKDRLKRFIFQLLGKDPEAIVVSFASGPPDLAQRMFAEVQQLIPDRRHFLVTPGDFRNVRQRFRRYRIGLAPVLFTEELEYRSMRRAAFLLAPFKILAYNGRLERYHLRPIGSPIASTLFARGVPLDRIHLRPIWLAPWKRDRTVYPVDHQRYEGRAFSPGRKRIAVLTPYFPYPLAHGGAVRMFNLIREMAKQFDVVLISFTDHESTDVAPMLEYCARVVTMSKPRYREPRWSTLTPPEVAEFRVPAMRKLVPSLRREWDIEILQVEYTALATYPGDILVEHDVTFALYRQIHQREKTLRSAWDYWRWKRFERRSIARYNRVVVMSEEDRKLLGRANAVVIPNGVDLARFRPEHERPGQRLLFIGSFRHFPNIVAYRFFVEHVWPLLKTWSPEVRFYVVAGPDPLLYWQQHTGLLEMPVDERIELLGFVADVRPLYIEANVVVVPTLVSAGTNLKVLEAMAMDRAVVSTPSGAAGMGLTNGENVWIAADPVSFWEAVRELLSNREMRQSMAAAGRRYVERNFDWVRIGAQQRTLIRQMTVKPFQIRPATTADVDQIWAIQSTAPEASQWHREDYLAFDCTVADENGRVAGFLVSRETVPGEREILNIAVNPEFRRLGVATELIRRELAEHPGEHFLEVRESNQPARDLYHHLGFREVGVRPGYYENPPEPGIVMRFFS
jgi:ribosomal protein S18 acetylase RimI-like enzyme/glycosyltransferase involved in cell wall biosynthesis